MRLIIATLLAAAVGGAAQIGAARAADYPAAPPYPGPPPPPPIYQPVPRPAFNWTGFYFGGFFGGAWHGGPSVSEGLAQGGALAGCYNVNCAPYKYDFGSSFMGGATIGFNWQYNPWFVFGLEGELGFLTLKGSTIDPNSAPFASDTIDSAKIGDWYALAAARFGYSWDNVLLYLKVGAAFVHINTSAVDTCGVGACGLATINATGSNTAMTWTLGGGVEWAFLRNWSVKAEYMYIALDETISTCGGAGAAGAGTTFCWSHHFDGLHTGKVGLNYRFGP